jgi:putative transposase
MHERGINICHETVRYWWNKLGLIVAKELKKKRTYAPSKWRWHMDEVFVKINGKKHYLWRAIDHEGTIIECYVTKRRNRKAALMFLLKALKRHQPLKQIVTDKLGG